MKKPKNIVEYKRWLSNEHNILITNRTEAYHNSVANTISKQFIESNFWSYLISHLSEWNEMYQLETSSYSLLDSSSEPEVVIKPFQSFINKTFRKNVLLNDAWPSPPKTGWLLPHNWYSRINDTARTYFVVKYLDGVSYLAEKMKEYCVTEDIPFHVDYEAKEEGYYAAHFYITQSMEIPSLNWDTETIEVQIELQITTQLQEVIRRLLHTYYEKRRIAEDGTTSKWQWDYKSSEFSANYLGHILHYIEGMILDVRDNKLSKEN